MIRRSLAPAVLAALTGLLILVSGSSTAGAEATVSPVGSAKKAILFSSDGLRQDLVHKYVDQGLLPTYKDLLDTGIEAGGNGLIQGFPPNTGVGWTTLATGTWPSEHGSTNNTFHRTGESNFNTST